MRGLYLRPRSVPSYRLKLRSGVWQPLLGHFRRDANHLAAVFMRTARSTPLFSGVVLIMRITAHESSPHLDLGLRSRFTLIAASSASRNKNAIARASALGLSKFHDRRHSTSNLR